MVDTQPTGQPLVTPEHVTSDEVLPPNTTIRGHEALPDGFVPMEPIPAGFILRSVLTRAELSDPDSAKRFVDEGRRFIKKHGRDAVLIARNVLQEEPYDPDSIAVAGFMRHNAKSLPKLKRLRRASSRAAFGIKCDVNF
jgi:hypothetical protein